MINFFASFCTACEAEMHTFATISKKALGVAFLGIDTNDPNLSKSLSILHHASARYPVLVDSAALNYAQAFGVANLPTTFLLNREGRVVREVLGLESPTELRKDLRAALRTS